MRKIRTHHKHKEGKQLAYLALITGIGASLTLPILPNFIKTILNTDTSVSVFYSGMAIIMLLAALASTYIFKKVDRAKTVKGSLLITSAAFLFLVFTTRIHALAFLNSLQVIFALFIAMSLSLYVRDYAKSKNLGKEEGKYFKYANLGYLIGPLIGGFTGAYVGYEAVFILSSLTFISAFFYFNHLHIVQDHPVLNSENQLKSYQIVSNLKQYFTNKNRCKVFTFTLFLMIWIGFRRLYIPLYVVFTGYIESMTGIIMALAILPLILLEVKTGEYADKHGVQKPIATGFIIMAISLFIIFFSPFTMLNFIVLILAHLGMAFVEPLQEYYLFKNLKKEEEDKLYGVYMTADPIALFITPVIGALTLLLLPFNYLFLVFGMLMILASAFSWVTLRHSLPDALPQESSSPQQP
ncbi:MAG: MFS transporter [Nitrospirae bacterium]|nr:MFS transporter [Nitrospirota bacterium]